MYILTEHINCQTITFIKNIVTTIFNHYRLENDTTNYYLVDNILNIKF